jgi:hypothetical protein
MKLVICVTVCILALAGCAGTTSVVNTELRSESITKLTKAIVATNLNNYMDADLFSAFSSKLQSGLQLEGVSVSVIPLPPPESVADKPNVKSEALKIGAKHVITLYKGHGVVMENMWKKEGYHYTQMEIIGNVIDVGSDKKIWGARFKHTMGGTVVPANDRAEVVVSSILAEMRKAGLLTVPATTFGEARTAKETATPNATLIGKESVESRLKNLEELYAKKLLSEAEYKKKRQELIDGI